MPLFIIAIVFLIGLLIYVITGYATGVSEKPSLNLKFPDKLKRFYPNVKFEVDESEPTNMEEKDET